MFPRISYLLVALAVLIAACSGAAEPPEPPRTDPSTTTSTSTTSTTLPPTTTTTTVPFSVEGATEPLTAVIEAFYAYASGESTTPPLAPDPVVEAINPGEVETPRTGTASVAAFKEQALAVVEMGSDFFLTLADGGGWRIVGGSWPSLSVPAYYGPAPRLVAVVGSDARPGQTPEATRADSIHFVGLDGAGKGAIVGVPRDSYVPVPGYGREKITASLALGGPDTMLTTFKNLTGLPLEGYVLTGFRGFQNLINVLGAVSVKVPFAISDRWAKAYLNAGRQDLDGAQALGFARARKTMPRGDFTRSEHQGMILISALAVVQHMGVSAIPQLMEAAEPHLSTNLTPEQLLTFSAMAVATDLNAIDNVVASGSPGRAGSASVVYLSSNVGQLWADLSNGLLSD